MQSLGESFNFVKHFQSLSFFVGIAVKRYHGSQIQKKKKKIRMTLRASLLVISYRYLG